METPAEQYARSRGFDPINLWYEWQEAILAFNAGIAYAQKEKPNTIKELIDFMDENQTKDGII